jgi:hypothetical protein
MQDKKRTSSNDFFAQNFSLAGTGSINTRNANKKMNALSMQIGGGGSGLGGDSQQRSMNPGEKNKKEPEREE